MAGDTAFSEKAGSSPVVAGKVAEYLEKYAADGFKRESDQEENVVRSLPFFATSFGVLLAFLSLARGAMPTWSFAPLPLAAYALLALILISLLLLIWFLFQAVRPRDFEYPMREAALVEYAKKLSGYYEQGDSTAAVSNVEGSAEPTGTATDAAILERAVVEDLRAAVLTQLATAAEISRGNNTKRLAARAGAFITLMTALIFALLLFVVILAGDKLPGAFS